MSAIGALLALVAACGEKDSDSIPDTLVDDSATESLPDDSSPVDDSSPNDDTGIPCPYDSYAEIQPIVDQDQDGYLDSSARNSCVIDHIIVGDFADAPAHLPDLLRRWRDGELTDDQVFDWDDNDRTVYPGAPEQCDDVDDDQDGVVDESPDPTHEDTLTFYDDTDNDGYGDPENPIVACTIPDMASENADDCDPSQTTVNPGAEEVCEDGIDNDCDGGPNDCSRAGEMNLVDSDYAFRTQREGVQFGIEVASVGNIDAGDTNNPNTSEEYAIARIQSETATALIFNDFTNPNHQSPIALEYAGPNDITSVSIAPAGDLDGDNYEDFWAYFVSSEPYSSGEPYATGEAYLVSGRLVATGSISDYDLVHIDGITMQSAFDLEDGFEGRVMAIGRDTQTPAVLLTTNILSTGGATFIFSDPYLATTWDISDADLMILPEGSEHVGTGYGDGDYDGDGAVDLILGASTYEISSNADNGFVGVFEDVGGLSGSLVLDDSNWKLTGSTDETLGNQALLSDLDNDGYADMVLAGSGLPGHDPDLGHVVIYRGGAAPSQTLDFEITYNADSVEGTQVGRELVAFALNDNDQLDLVVGTDGGNNNFDGSAYVYYDLSLDGSVLTLNDADYRLVNEDQGDGVGKFMAGVENPRNDGINALLIGAPGVSVTADETDDGAAYINYWDNLSYL